MSELDVLLRESLGRLAEPGDPSGVVDAIRARVEAAGSPGAGGSGGGAGASGSGVLGASSFWSGPGVLGILIGLSVAGGAALGLSGAVGRPDAPPALPVGPAYGVVSEGVEALGCPGGAAVDSLDPGTRVLATEISEDGGFVAVRNPYALSRTVWLPTAALVPDEGAGSYADLPVGGCAEPSALPSPSPSPSPSPTPAPGPAPEPAPAPAPKPQPQPQPQPQPDTQAPTASAGGVSPSTLYGSSWSCGANTGSVTVTATDNVGVANVAGSSSFPGVTVTLQSHSGNSWVFTVATPAGQPSMGSDVGVTLTFVATDAAGNAGQAGSSFTYAYCLI